MIFFTMFKVSTLGVTDVGAFFGDCSPSRGSWAEP